MNAKKTVSDELSHPTDIKVTVNNTPDTGDEIITKGFRKSISTSSVNNQSDDLVLTPRSLDQKDDPTQSKELASDVNDTNNEKIVENNGENDSLNRPDGEQQDKTESINSENTDNKLVFQSQTLILTPNVKDKKMGNRRASIPSTNEVVNNDGDEINTVDIKFSSALVITYGETTESTTQQETQAPIEQLNEIVDTDVFDDHLTDMIREHQEVREKGEREAREEEEEEDREAREEVEEEREGNLEVKHDHQHDQHGHQQDQHILDLKLNLNLDSGHQLVEEIAERDTDKDEEIELDRDVRYFHRSRSPGKKSKSVSHERGRAISLEDKTSSKINTDHTETSNTKESEEAVAPRRPKSSWVELDKSKRNSVAYISQSPSTSPGSYRRSLSFHRKGSVDSIETTAINPSTSNQSGSTSSVAIVASASSPPSVSNTSSPEKKRNSNSNSNGNSRRIGFFDRINPTRLIPTHYRKKDTEASSSPPQDIPDNITPNKKVMNEASGAQRVEETTQPEEDDDIKYNYQPAAKDFKGRMRLVVVMQACIRARMAKKLVKQAIAEKCMKFTQYLTSNKDLEAKVIRLQSVIKSKLTRLNNTPSSLNKLRKRHYIAMEILKTEETYVHGLHCLTDIFLHNLKSLDKSIVPPEQLRAIFSNVEVIHKYNTLILNQLKKRMQNWYTEKMQIGDIFMKFVDFLKVYTSYVNNYNKSFMILTELSKNSLVAESLMKSRSHPDVKGSELQNFLIMPIQRIPRYMMLLTDLLKNTEDTADDYSLLSAAVQKMATVADYVNERKREAENLHAVCVVASRVSGYPAIDGNKSSLALPSRTFIRQGALSIFQGDISSLDAENMPMKNFKQRYIFLFNDMVLATKKTFSSGGGSGISQKINWPGNVFKRGGVSDSYESDIYTLDELKDNDELQFKYSSLLPLEGLEVIDYADNAATNKYYFALKECDADKVKFVVAAKDAKTKSDFLQDVDDAIWNKLKAKRSHYKIEKSNSKVNISMMMMMMMMVIIYVLIYTRQTILSIASTTQASKSGFMCGNLHKQGRFFYRE
eukprot:TRINITY_DN2802_c0_g1_i5.p1 TRINITY_DN2802_c0_g1~~TRINITY_DN2802_c0_g1_i5.p1  ORF type:complete len:1190 (+),score=298.97 TRINITY_DN2802_c0_g1_i5:430-3570(+)